MILKAIDLSLMSEHLNMHKGILPKLETYYCIVRNPELKQIIYEQYLIMRNHVRVMLALMDDRVNESITVNELNNIQPVQISCKSTSNPLTETEIALELSNTSKTMAHDNFSSALKMKADNVRNIHSHMAYQQLILQYRYNQIINQLQQLEVAPTSSLEEQRNTLATFKKIFGF